MTRTIHAALLAAALLAAACGGPAPAATPAPGPREPPPPAPPLEYRPLTTGLPPFARVNGPLDLRVVEPSGGAARPRVDSTAIYGTVGTGGAWLTINDTPVPVAPNGAFIAYLQVPADGVWRLVAWRAAERDTLTIAYRTAVATSAAATPPRAFSPALALQVRGADTLATGSDAAHARPTPTGTYRWFFPAGTRLSAVEQRGGQYRVQLDSGTVAWIDTADVAPETPVARSRTVAAIGARPAAGWVDLRIPADFAPFRVEADSAAWSVTIYGAVPRPGAGTAGDPLLAGWSVEPVGGQQSGRVVLRVGARPWGYKAFYDADGTLVLRLRRPPAIDPQAPLRGRRIVVDPGHPPAGATGPTGLTEAEANLAVASSLAEMLRAAGAEVILTRTGDEPVGLAERTAMAVRADGEVLVSLHNNAFGEGQNPFRAFHTTVYHFQPWSADLAAALDRAVVAVTGLPDRGARAENLALVRPTWMPSALTESVFMPIPEQENALRDPDFVRRLAEAHLRGIEAFLRALPPSPFPLPQDPALD